MLVTWFWRQNDYSDNERMLLTNKKCVQEQTGLGEESDEHEIIEETEITPKYQMVYAQTRMRSGE